MFLKEEEERAYLVVKWESWTENWMESWIEREKRKGKEKKRVDLS